MWRAVVKSMDCSVLQFLAESSRSRLVSPRVTVRLRRNFWSQAGLSARLRVTLCLSSLELLTDHTELRANPCCEPWLQGPKAGQQMGTPPLMALLPSMTALGLRNIISCPSTVQLVRVAPNLWILQQPVVR